MSKIEEIAERHELDQDERCADILAALRELLEECCKEVETENRVKPGPYLSVDRLLARLRRLGESR